MFEIICSLKHVYTVNLETMFYALGDGVVTLGIWGTAEQVRSMSGVRWEG